MEKPTCGTCPFYDAKATTEVYPRLPMGGGFGGSYTIPAIHVLPQTVSGLCKRHANQQPHKDRNDWCGEHPEFAPWINSLKAEAYDKKRQEVLANSDV